MSINTVNKVLFSQTSEAFNTSLTGYDATNYNLQFELDIRDQWQSTRSRHLFIKIITLGIACFFLPTITSKESLEYRITLLRDFSHDMEAKVKRVQQIAAKRLYKAHNIVSAKLSPHQSPQFNSSLSTLASLGKLWLQQGYPNLWSGHRGQIIWDRTKKLVSALKEQGNYVFLHAHSYPITLHLELASHFQALHQSDAFKACKPEESRRKFRAPGVAESFENTAAYLKSNMAHAINSGQSMDDNHRETIISCDVITDNNEAYESTQHFFKSNRSIVDTHSSTGMSYSSFDSKFISSFIQDCDFKSYAVSLFAKARKELHGIADYGMIRIIAVAKKTIENPTTNYTWRSHAFGRICTCKHSTRKFGHAEFVETLKSHQKGVYNYCTEVGVNILGLTGKTPQYRVLAANVDRDMTKQVYTMDCLNDDEKRQYHEIYSRLKTPLEHIISLQQMANCKTVAELGQILSEINVNEPSLNYKRGLSNIIEANKELITKHWHALSKLLPANTHSFISSRL